MPLSRWFCLAAGEDRAFFVTAGEGTLTLGGQQMGLKPVGAFGVPAGVKHGMFNESADKPMTCVAIGVRIPGMRAPLCGGEKKSPRD